MSYGYERGEFSRIELAYDDATGTVTIGAREGDFEGMPVERTITVRWMGREAVDATVTYSGEPLDVTRP